MKKPFLLLLLRLLFAGQIMAQSGALPSKIDFSGFAPTKLDQFKGTCYAYATTYTALSVKYNILKQAQTLAKANNQAFSPAFTAAMVRKERFFLWKWFTLWSCSYGGNIEKAVGIIEKFGALPNKDKNGCCFVPGKLQLDTAKPYRSKPATLIVQLNDPRDVAVIVLKFKSALAQQEPIVCAIHQTQWLLGNQHANIVLPKEGDKGLGGNAYLKSNHAICVLGYDDTHLGGGSFLIKNNYSTWGSNGFAWIKYADFIPYLSYALILGSFQQPALL